MRHPPSFTSKRPEEEQGWSTHHGTAVDHAESFFTVCQSNTSFVADDVCGEQKCYFNVSEGTVSFTKIANAEQNSRKALKEKHCTRENVDFLLLMFKN